MVLTKESGIVKVWVNLIMTGTYTVEQVPNLFNLKEVVGQVINSTLQCRSRKIL